MTKVLATTLAVASMALAGAITAHAADFSAPRAEDGNSGGVRIGYLSCDIGEGGGYLLGSAKELDCVFRSSFRGERSDRYSGVVKKFGIDLGYTAQGKLVWAVIAPTAGYHHGSLSGTYVGAAAEATLGAGVGANVLLGGTGGSIQLQTISVSGQLGLNVAAAGATVTLASAD
jgi:Protein of unknown function (DUF992)